MMAGMMMVMVMMIGMLGSVSVAMTAAEQQGTSSMDVAFVIDATASMSDEIENVQENMLELVDKLQGEMAGREADGALGVPPTLRIGVVFFRDRGDGLHDHLEVIPMTTNLEAVRESIRSVGARGGGDYPEDVQAGLQAGIDLEWRTGSDVMRTVYLVGDARSKKYDDASSLSVLAEEAKQAHIVINTIMCSGLDPVGVKEFKALAEKTGGVAEHLVYKRTVVDENGQEEHYYRQGTDHYRSKRDLDAEDFGRGMEELVDSGELLLLEAKEYEDLDGVVPESNALSKQIAGRQVTSYREDL